MMCRLFRRRVSGRSLAPMDAKSRAASLRSLRMNADAGGQAGGQAGAWINTLKHKISMRK